MNVRSMSGSTGTQALILAGGRGERLYPLTAFRPKPAIPFGGVFRIVDFTLSNCLNSKLDRVALLTQYRHEVLNDYIRQRWSELWKTGGKDSHQLVCLAPAAGRRYRGTADAVFQNLAVVDSAKPEYVLILSGDHIYEMDYRELLSRHVATNADVTIAAIEYPIADATHFGVLEVNKDFRVTGFEEKPLNPRGLPLQIHMALVSMGVYVFKRDVLIRNLVENCQSAVGYDFGHNIIPALIDSARVYAYDFRDEMKGEPRYWRDIGTIDSYHDASMDLVRPEPLFNPYRENRWHSGPTSFHNGPHVCGGAQVALSVLSPGVRIERDSSVEQSVLMPGVRVGPGARIRRAILEEGVQIPADFQVGWEIEYDRKLYTVSPKGVVVVSEMPKLSEPVLPYSLQEKTIAGFKSDMRRKVRRHAA